jgi:hypothetical protein
MRLVHGDWGATPAGAGATPNDAITDDHVSQAGGGHRHYPPWQDEQLQSSSQ